MIHLTNYAINKNNPNFIFNKAASQANVGHKRSYTAVMQNLSEMSVDVPVLKQRIN